MSSDTILSQALQYGIAHTSIPGLPAPYRGKVRDVYELDASHIGIVVTDRISAFDYIMKQTIPFKGQILNQLAAFSFSRVKDIVPTHLVSVPHPNVTIARKCEAIPVEVVVRGYLTGHAWRVYKSGERLLCGVLLPEGMKEHDKFPAPIITPATKAEEGHDEDISEAQILKSGIVEPALWKQITQTALRLFARGTEIAAAQGLILVDTKYEFGLCEGQLTLIDEVHTADSSRYFYLEGYEQRQAQGDPQKQLSKEFLREWLMSQGFQGLDNQPLPDLPDEFRIEVYKRYAELYETLTAQKFTPVTETNINSRLQEVFAPWI